MRCKKNKKKKIKFLAILLLIVTLMVCYLEIYVNPQIVQANLAQIKSTSNQTINDGIKETLQQNSYDNLITIEKDNEEKVRLIKVNSLNVNLLNTNVISAIQKKFEEEKPIQIYIPLGTFTGLPILNGYGREIPIKLIPIGSVETRFLSQFSSVAINQSCHKIFLNITITVSVLLPLYTQNVDITSQILIGESIIVGEIPNVYLNTDNLTNALNLIP